MSLSYEQELFWADRFEEMNGHFVEMADRIEELEAKLAKALKALECYAGYWADDKTVIQTNDGGELASETIKERTGGKDDL